MSKLYDDILLDHIRNARNYREMADADRRGESTNPLCGDTFSVFVRIEDGRLADVSFQCECCGISMASASVMTGWVRGRTVAEARALQKRFVEALQAREDTLGGDAPPDHEAVMRVVKATPAREGCAAMAWRALEAALPDAADAPGPDPTA